MEIKLENESLELTINSFGAELKSITGKETIPEGGKLGTAVRGESRNFTAVKLQITFCFGNAASGSLILRCIVIVIR